jgi:hypothetical protein
VRSLYVALCVLVCTVSLILVSALYIGTRVWPIVMTPNYMLGFIVGSVVVGIYVTSRLISDL